MQGREVCPHCSQPLRPSRYGITFGPLAIRIIDAIERGGRDGVTIADLSVAIYPGQRHAVVRLKNYIGLINHELAKRGVAIRIADGCARIGIRRAA